MFVYEEIDGLYVFCSWIGVLSNYFILRIIMVDLYGNVYLVNDKVRNIGFIFLDMWIKY